MQYQAPYNIFPSQVPPAAARHVRGPFSAAWTGSFDSLHDDLHELQE